MSLAGRSNPFVGLRPSDFGLDSVRDFWTGFYGTLQGVMIDTIAPIAMWLEDLLGVRFFARVNELVVVSRPIAHLALYFGLAYCGRRLYRWVAFKKILREIRESHVSVVYAKRYAGFWRRVLAALIDGIIILVAIMAIDLPVLVVFDYLDANAEALVVLNLFGIQIVVPWLYEALMISSSRQATLGKMALGLLVTDKQGNRVSFARATGRFFGKVVSYLILLIGYLMQPFTARKQTLHDIMAGCVVMYVPRKQRRKERLMVA